MLICKEEMFCDLLGPNYEYIANTDFLGAFITRKKYVTNNL